MLRNGASNSSSLIVCAFLSSMKSLPVIHMMDFVCGAFESISTLLSEGQEAHKVFVYLRRLQISTASTASGSSPIPDYAQSDPSTFFESLDLTSLQSAFQHCLLLQPNLSPAFPCCPPKKMSQGLCHPQINL